jgi:hypothetical protein
MNDDAPWESCFQFRLARLTSSVPTEMARLPFFSSSRERAVNTPFRALAHTCMIRFESLERPHRSAITMTITIKYPCHSDFARYFLVMAKKVARSGQSRHNHKRIFYGYVYGCHKPGRFMADLYRTITSRHNSKTDYGVNFCSALPWSTGGAAGTRREVVPTQEESRYAMGKQPR